MPCFDAIHNVMKDRVVTNLPHVIDSSSTQQIDVSRRDSEEDELLSFMPHKNPSIEVIIGEDSFEEEPIQTSTVKGRQTPSSSRIQTPTTQPNSGRQTPSSLEPSSRVQMPTTEPNSGRQTPSSLEASSRVQTSTTQPNSSSIRQTPSTTDSTESGPVIATTSAGEKRTTSQSDSKKRKVSKMERAEKASADMLEGVMKNYLSRGIVSNCWKERESSKKRNELNVSH